MMFALIGSWLAKSVLMQSPIGAFVGAAVRALKRFFGMLDLQGWIGLALSIFLAIKLVHSIGEERHWKKQSGQFERLYHDEQSSLAGTVANYRAAADQARKADTANKVRVEAEQAQINKEQSDEYEARVTAARALADRLRHELAAAANPGSTGKPPVSGIPAPADQPPQTATDRLSDALTATEQAIQLDELIKWVRRQHDVDPNGTPPTEGAKP